MNKDLFESCRQVGEGKVPNDKDSEETKVKKLTEEDINKESKVKKENVIRNRRSRRKVNESKIKEGFIVLFNRDFDSSKLSDDEVDEYYMEAMSEVDTIEDAKKELEVELEEVKDEDKKSIIQSIIAADEEDLEILRDNIKFLKVEAKNRGIELKESKIKVKSEEISLDEQKQMIRLNDLLNL